MTEAELQTAFVRAVNTLLLQREQMREEFNNIQAAVDTAELKKRLTGLKKRLNVAADKMDACIERNARFSLNQSDFNSDYAKLEKEYTTLQNKADSTSDEIARRQIQKSRVSDFLKVLDKLGAGMTSFDEELFITLTDRVTVYAKDDIRVTFANGVKIKA